MKNKSICFNRTNLNKSQTKSEISLSEFKKEVKDSRIKINKQSSMKNFESKIKHERSLSDPKGEIKDSKIKMNKQNLENKIKIPKKNNRSSSMMDINPLMLSFSLEYSMKLSNIVSDSDNLVNNNMKKSDNDKSYKKQNIKIEINKTFDYNTNKSNPISSHIKTRSSISNIDNSSIINNNNKFKRINVNKTPYMGLNKKIEANNNKKVKFNAYSNQIRLNNIKKEKNKSNINSDNLKIKKNNLFNLSTYYTGDLNNNFINFNDNDDFLLTITHKDDDNKENITNISILDHFKDQQNSEEIISPSFNDEDFSKNNLVGILNDIDKQNFFKVNN